MRHVPVRVRFVEPPDALDLRKSVNEVSTFLLARTMSATSKFVRVTSLSAASITCLHAFLKSCAASADPSDRSADNCDTAACTTLLRLPSGSVPPPE